MNGRKTLFLALGGAGGSIVRYLPPEFERLYLNTDSTAMRDTSPSLLLGERLIQGEGCNRTLALGMKAIDESWADIKRCLAGVDAVVIVAGMAGGTGGNALYLAKKLLDSGIAVAVAWIKPFSFEKDLTDADERFKLLSDIQDRLLSIRYLSPHTPKTGFNNFDSFINHLDKSLSEELVDFLGINESQTVNTR